MYGDDFTIGDVTSEDIGADSAAVHKGDVCAQDGAVGIGAQVAQVGLPVPNQTLAGFGVVYHQVHIGLGHHFVQLVAKLGLDVLDESVGLCVHLRVAVHQLRGDLALRGDGHLADVGQLGAGGGENYIVAGLVLYGLARDGAVGVAVDEGVQAGGVGDDLSGGPGRGLLVNAAVANGDDHIGACLRGGVNGALNCIVQVLAVVALTEAVDVVAVFVLEVGGGGFGEGFRGADAHVRNLQAAVGLHGVGIGHSLVCPQIYEVAGQVLGVGLLQQGEGYVHPIVELMVAKGGVVVAHLVHDVHQVAAVGQGANGLALDGVAGVNQHDMLMGFLHGVFVGSQVGIPHGVFRGTGIHAAVHVVGVEHHDVVRLFASGKSHGRQRREYQHQCQQHGQDPRGKFTSHVASSFKHG